MHVKGYWFLLLVSFTLLLPSCANGGDTLEYDIVGRWEAYTNEEHSEGVVIEFLSDGENSAYLFNTPTNYLYPDQYDQRWFLYSTRDDTMSFTGQKREDTDDIPLVLLTDIYRVAFPAADQLVLTSLDKTQVITLQRVATPQIPFPARAVVGGYLSQEGCSLLGVEPLAGSWQEAYPGYVETDRAWSRVTEAPGQWVASLQVEGDLDTRLLVIIEGQEDWTWVLLEKEE
jgi:hypothetical protein